MGARKRPLPVEETQTWEVVARRRESYDPWIYVEAYNEAWVIRSSAAGGIVAMHRRTRDGWELVVQMMTPLWRRAFAAARPEPRK